MSGDPALAATGHGQTAARQHGSLWPNRARNLLTSRGLLLLSLLLNAPGLVSMLRPLSHDTGIPTLLASYPATVQDSILLLAHPIGSVIAFFSFWPNQVLGAVQLLAVETACAMVLLCTVITFPSAVRSYLRIFCGEQAAGWAALPAVCLAAVVLAVWPAGWLASVPALVAVSLSLERANAYARSGSVGALVQAVALASLAGALCDWGWLFWTFAAAAVIGRDLAEVVRTRRRVPGHLVRLVSWACPSALATAIVAWPGAVPLLDRLGMRWPGIAPASALFVAVTAGAVQRARAGNWQILPVVVRMRHALWTLTVFLSALWLLHQWPVLPPSGIRTTPLPLQLYASDLSMAATLAAWCLERMLRRQPLVLGPRLVAGSGALVIVGSAVSIPGSLDPALSLAVTVHLLVLAGFYLLCVNDPSDPAHIGWLFAALLALQAVFGLLEAWTQSTAFLGELHLFGPVLLTAAMSGASVVGAADGEPWLRAYGTLVHPNVLGGMLLIYLGAAVERQLATGRRLWLFIIAAGVVVLFLSFSRSAWIGMLAMGVTLSVTLAPGSTGRLRWVFAVAGLAFALMALAFWPIVRARIGAAPVPVAPEVRSISERLVLLRVGFAAIQERPLFGLGAGTFTEWVARLPGRPAPIEPIHNVPLLVVAETGLVGLSAWLMLGAGLACRVWRGWRRLTSWEAAWTAALIGMLVASMADHYWWTMAPMRTMFVIALALFAARPGYLGADAPPAGLRSIPLGSAIRRS